ncbi:MAG: UDP-3-O-acyl-N-acetylglucosamine deacetylase [Planctomycetes bacterium]|nr:UDP-3-O-acyl-N-acetylglucosamine deacetylase [Planctomycetota bacterium]
MSESARPQQTLAGPAALRGRGLHTNREVEVTVKPAPPDAGVVFVRTDLPGSPRIPLREARIENRGRRTCLVEGEADVHTVEHLLACFMGLGIDNAVVEMSGPELPGLDGSALPYLAALKTAGVEVQKVPRPVLALDREIVLDQRAEDVFLMATPGPGGLFVTYTLDYKTPEIPLQRFSVEVTPATFEKEIAPARTFCLESEADALRAAGLGQGATFENTLVVDRDGKPKENQLRFPDEYVRHKVLDLLGDLFVLGVGLEGRVLALRSGHQANQELVRRLRDRYREKVTEASRLEQVLDIREIMRILPHRYPFLLIDRVVELEGYQRAVGLKNVSINEPFFQGHWPEQPVMPGVLIVEAMAQLSGVLLLRKLEHTGRLAVLLAIDRVKLRRAVVPGDQLRIEAVAETVKGRTGRVFCRAAVEGKLAAEARIKFMLMDAT